MINNLLQLKNSLKKYGEHIKTIKHPHFVNENLLKWYKSYTKGYLEKEEENYTYFASTILTGVLGYHDQIDFKHEAKLRKGKSVDFLILKDGEPYIAIELKSSNTILDKKYNKRPSAVDQAFDYATEKKSIEWIIVSNYYEYRLYNKNTKENMISFNLDELIYHNGDKHILQLFLLVFSKESVLDYDNLTKLYDKDHLIIEREKITKNFYKLYHHTRTLLIDQLQDKGYIKEDSINYSQTILNRLIFICFCEDMGLLPDNSVNYEILEPVKRGKLGNNRIWMRLNDLWDDINHGNSLVGIPEYNGGLFHEDLNKLSFNDEIENNDHNNTGYGFNEKEEMVDKTIINFPNLNPIYRNLLIITSFNYSSELNINILGSIFEQSVNDIEKLKQVEVNISQRKKHGIYYTPEIITEYICENTIILYLSKKKNIDTIKDLINEYKDDLWALEDKLKNIKILDPACGSGAFLNKAVDTLMNIHSDLHDYKYRDNGNSDLKPFFDDVDSRRNILLNNIYGVDLNKGSVEITKLSLLLKVAQSEDKLPDLDKNIKCGNSLIDDSDVIDTAFNWNEEFLDAFQDVGFDIVIGNPPYLNAKIMAENNPTEREYLLSSGKYKTLHQKWDLYIPFVEKGLELLKEKGIFSMIIPYPFVNQTYAKLLREEISEKYNLIKIVDLSKGKIFADATVKNCIPIIEKDKNKNSTIIATIKNNIIENVLSKNIDELISDKKTFVYNLSTVPKLQKDFSKYKTLGDFCYISKGMVLNADEKIAKGEFRKADLIADFKDDVHKKQYIEGKNLERYKISKIRFLEWDSDRVPSKISRPTFKELYENEKIVINKLGEIKGSYDNENIYCDQTIRIAILWKNLKGIDNKSINNSVKRYNLTNRNELEENSKNIELKYLLSILNSNMGNFFINNIRGEGNIDINPEYLKKIPVPEISLDKQKSIAEKVDIIINSNIKSSNEIKSFHKYLISDFKITKINKLQNYHVLSFEELYNEVKKQYKEITRKEKDKLEKEYTISIEIIQPLQKEIAKIDDEIDKILYKLYDLTDEEVSIIEEIS
ncbi:MAG: Eco57I restriction-modification methylase domain-containing protein [Methanobrevibacter sp.]|jgi:hypothetical protein|nr:Eco57I restriction-modification methylase domain-containing protein [Candidatus Methanovirga meridionalis]